MLVEIHHTMYILILQRNYIHTHQNLIDIDNHYICCCSYRYYCMHYYYWNQN